MKALVVPVALAAWALAVVAPARPAPSVTPEEAAAIAANLDGSTDIYIQKDNPGPDPESNWLPAPPGRFVLMFGFYWPEEPIVNGTWTPPAVRRVAN